MKLVWLMKLEFLSFSDAGKLQVWFNKSYSVTICYWKCDRQSVFCLCVGKNKVKNCNICNCLSPVINIGIGPLTFVPIFGLMWNSVMCTCSCTNTSRWERSRCSCFCYIWLTVLSQIVLGINPASHFYSNNVYKSCTLIYMRLTNSA